MTRSGRRMASIRSETNPASEVTPMIWSTIDRTPFGWKTFRDVKRMLRTRLLDSSREGASCHVRLGRAPAYEHAARRFVDVKAAAPPGGVGAKRRALTATNAGRESRSCRCHAA